MTGAEMERAIEFLLQSQASLESQVAETNRIVQFHAETQTEFMQTMTRYIEAQGEINASLRAAVSRTDERLDRLEAVVERYIEGRGGQA
ncbi:MAG TPA: hypothetical protein VGW12_10010 [Pyrinomonadaceae bacterium]|nr:hypothetical protein [Pyrinomonadaceae bacterium]